MKERLLYRIMFCCWYAVSKLPAGVHYFNSLWLSALLFHVIRYRRKLVHRQMRDSFPEKSDKELWRMERRFYLHFCDILAESVMYFGMSEEEIKRRMHFVNAEIVRASASKGRNIGVYLGHYANWEWVSSFSLWTEGTCVPTQLYHPLENPVFDRLIAYTRQRFGGVNISVNESVRMMMKLRQQGKPILVGFIADQAPFWNNIHYWTPFLNHPETPIFTGAEKLMKKLDMDVYYLDVRQVRRGHYEAEFVLITDKPKEQPEFAVTERYTRLLEQTIVKAPALWLWSHNRWKRTKKEWLKMYDPESGKVIMG
ncbi:MAG: lysophospholipid acyltransferase family protein [Bacteroidales bacterium]|nr:lysophospholipid acyltransferase family protein [Bacteroidales bacterium]MCM1146531.1 lysophospholipid acyltransferase family protein [Bacteroidales bacterium]MCM1205923.1 lysophospholipid acyltransferase family protein [Bacillota bacterium]MCM1510199.1 lysophospholipid acyltransferase family protein [Clostridium sp.]